MATIYKNIIPSKLIESASTMQYTTATAKAIIDKFTALNTDSVERTITVYIVPGAGSPSATNMVVKTKAISAGQTASLHELIGHVMEAGGSIYTAASAATAISIRASGREIS